MSRYRRANTIKGSGLVNSIINHLPAELHLPGYRFCGPGTKLKQRLARGERGINSLDELAREHDIAYDKSNVLSDRREADKILENQAWNVFKSKNTGLKEKAASWFVTSAMKMKRKLGAGCGFKAGVKEAKKVLKKNIKEANLFKLAKMCVAAARKIFRKNKNKIKTPRVVPIPKKGGMLPLLPIFAGLSALGALTGGVSNVVKTISEFNRKTSSHLGNGLFLRPHRGNSYKIESDGKKLSKNYYKKTQTKN